MLQKFHEHQQHFGQVVAQALDNWLGWAGLGWAGLDWHKWLASWPLEDNIVAARTVVPLVTSDWRDRP